MKNIPKFFVFTCVKNGRAYINKLFDSMLAQTSTNFVHFIYEDGSSEPLNEIVYSYQEKASKLPNPFDVIYEKSSKNIGLNMATMYCIQKCDKSFFIWIDCDNWIDKDFFRYLGKRIDKHQHCDIVRSKLITEPYIKNNQKIYNNWKKELEMFFRSKYYYSFFAVRFAFFKRINPSLFFLDNKSFFNDDQVLLLSLCNKAKLVFEDRSVGYFLTRDNQESSGQILIQDGKQQQLEFLKIVSTDCYIFVDNYYRFKDMSREIEKSINKSPAKAKLLYKKLLLLCKQQHFPYSLLNFKNPLYIWLRIFVSFIRNVCHEK